MESYYERVNPDPSRVIEGLRDTGYQIETAIEDIIDNSIAANAQLIDVKLKMDFDGSVLVYILDNGYGMNKPELIDAMKYGSKKRLDPASLGKFGMGLKTASTAFCRQLSVISRDQKSSGFSKATWDLDHVVEVGEWDLAISEPTKSELDYIKSIIGDSQGTLVVWDKVDRLLKDYVEPGGKYAREAFEKMVNNLKEHASMVYQRFLDPNDQRARTVILKINDNTINAWNPFCPNVSELVAEEKINVKIGENDPVPITLRAYVLPRKEDVDSKNDRENLKISNDNQGIYIYRENRMIYGPDWMRMYSKEPHFSLLRLEFSFDYRLDDAFNIDIKKSQISLDEGLYKYIRDKFLPAPRRAAETRYRLGLKKKAYQNSKNMHDPSNNTIQSKDKEVSEATVKVVNKDKDQVEVTNKYGSSLLKIKIIPAQKPGEVYIQPVPSVEDGLLWEPAIIEGKKAVRINTGHKYYTKVYLPNKNSGVLVEGLDSLLWALGEAEFETINTQTQKYFEEMRREVSRILRTLVEDLPEPVDDTDEQ